MLSTKAKEPIKTALAMTNAYGIWNVAGFVTIIICLEAGGSAENAFNIAVLRAQESGLGILVYSLVAILLWPIGSVRSKLR